MLDSVVMFILGVLAMAIAVLFYQFKNIGAMRIYFGTTEGKKVLSGIIGFVAFGVVSALVFVTFTSILFPNYAVADEKKINYLAYGKVYVGLDVPREQSPQCKSGPYSDKLTSNGGLVINLVQSRDKRFETNFKYTHHSCAFNADQHGYDAAGISIEYRLW